MEITEQDEQTLFKKIYTKKPCSKCWCYYCICGRLKNV